MGAEQSNRLAHSASPYLRSAAHQPVDWYEWGEEAFARARAEDKPILLDIGAVWCHWCHVIDRESYEDPALATLINQQFVPVKVDRDERPDVDARYQTAISALSGQGGWPLTGFLLSDGRPFYGGTYFPPQDGMGRPSFRRVLETIVETFKTRRDEVEKAAGALFDAVRRAESSAGARGTWDARFGERTQRHDPSAFRPALWWIRQRTQISALRLDRSSSRALSGDTRAAIAACRADHARKNGSRRRLRSARRRLSSLFG